MKKFFTRLLATMLIAAPMLFIQAFGQYNNLASRNYPPKNTSVVFSKSNLPIVIISTKNANNGYNVLNRKDRVMGHMVVINNVDEKGNPMTNYADLKQHPDQNIECNLPIALKWRGNTSFGGDYEQSKKPISIKILNKEADDVNDSKEKVKLLGMGKDNDWALLAPWQDQSYVRDILTMVMAQGGYTFAPKMRFCELVFNETYYGVFILSERATKGSKRLDLWDYGYSDDKDANGNKIPIDDTTGDFHVEIDRPTNPYTREVEPHYTSQYRPAFTNGREISGKYITYQYKDPEESDFAATEDWNAATQAIKVAIDEMEGSFRSNDYTSKYPEYIDINSFIDYEIAQEVSNNIDGYRLSTPMWKYSKTHAQASGGNDKWKIALWDFNIAYGHSFGNYYDPWREDWRYTANDIMKDYNSDDDQLIPFYWYKLMNDETYVQQLKERYTKRRKLSYTDARVVAICDSLKDILNQGAADRDNSAWSNFGDLDNQVASVVNFTIDRLNWMDARWLIDSGSSEDPDDPDEPITTGKAEPLAIASGYNMDVICENHNDVSGTVYTGDYCGIDDSHFVFYTSTVKKSGALCKDDGIFSSENADYFIDVTSNNALVMKTNFASGGELTLASPAKLKTLYVTGTGANGSSNVYVTVKYSDGTKSTPVKFYVPNWDGPFSNCNFAASGLGRMSAVQNYNGPAGSFGSSDKFCIFELGITTDVTKDVKSVSFSFTGQCASIFSLSGVYATTDFQLAGTTFWKDNSWNTICLPFDVEDIEDTPLAGAIVKTLVNSDFNDGTLSLTFNEDNLTSLKAGKPYIMKWIVDEESQDSNPTFNDVVVKGKEQPAVTDYVDYIGSYNEIKLEGGDYTSLYLGANNTLYYPAEGHDITINPYHAYFKLKGSAAGENGASKIRAINIDFNDDPQGIQTIVAPTNELIDYWYTLDGRRLTDKPTTSGIYLHQGRRVMIK